MLQRCPRLPLHMHAPLKWNVVIRSRARKSGDAGVHGFDVHKVQGVFQPSQFVLKLWAEPRGSRLHACTSTTEPPGKGVALGNVVDGFDAEGDELRDLAGVDSRK